MPNEHIMKLTLEHHHLRSTDELDWLVENQILALQPRLAIDEANVRLEFRFQESPAFRVRIHLVTPGPDLFAESSDHTIRAAFAKALMQLRENIASRATKRLRRLKNHSSVPAAITRSARWR